jgi:tRNA U34 5-methylaminomethyl-2-thiouridine-forming methyltransferase MnmC
MFNLIYFDAFSPDVQPELWTDDVFRKLYSALATDGILVTYSSKGTVKQALRNAGYTVERLPGAAGKRHMLRAKK